MRRLFIAFAAALAWAPFASAQDFTDSQKEEIGELIRAYMLENPELIEEAILELQRRQREAEAERTRAAVAESYDELYHNPADFSVGPEDAPIQIVEFFDYNCGYCRRAAPWLKDLIEERGDEVRIVFKETPIFAFDTEGSSVGAKAAIASAEQDKYLDLHFALMEHAGVLEPEHVEGVAKSVGLDWRKMQRTMNSDETEQRLEDTIGLGHLIGVTGTPTFVVNGEVIVGADIIRIEEIIFEMLEERTAANDDDGATDPEANLR